jgi:copper chaperone CopZ
MTTRTYSVPQISCDHCVHAITGEVTKLAGVSDVTVDIAGKTVTVVGDAPDADIVAAIDEAGYAVSS